MIYYHPSKISMLDSIHIEKMFFLDKKNQEKVKKLQYDDMMKSTARYLSINTVNFLI